jgi:hypothetical protein
LVVLNIFLKIRKSLSCRDHQLALRNQQAL